MQTVSVFHGLLLLLRCLFIANWKNNLCFLNTGRNEGRKGSPPTRASLLNRKRKWTDGRGGRLVSNDLVTMAIQFTLVATL